MHAVDLTPPKEMTFENAQVACAQEGGHIVVPSSEGEQATVDAIMFEQRACMHACIIFFFPAHLFFLVIDADLMSHFI